MFVSQFLWLKTSEQFENQIPRTIRGVLIVVDILYSKKIFFAKSRVAWFSF